MNPPRWWWAGLAIMAFVFWFPFACGCADKHALQLKVDCEIQGYPDLDQRTHGRVSKAVQVPDIILMPDGGFVLL